MAEERHDNYLDGVVEKVFEARQGVSQSTGNTWKLQPFLLKYQEGNFEKIAYFEIFGENACNNNPVMVGQKVRVLFNVESREFNGRYYTSLRAWSVRPLQIAQAQPSAVEQELRAKAEPSNPVNAPTYHNDPAVKDDDPFA